MRTKPRFVGRLLLGLAALAVGCAPPTPSPLEEICAALRAWDFAGAWARLQT